MVLTKPTTPRQMVAPDTHPIELQRLLRRCPEFSDEQREAIELFAAIELSDEHPARLRASARRQRDRRMEAHRRIAVRDVRSTRSFAS